MNKLLKNTTPSAVFVVVAKIITTIFNVLFCLIHRQGGSSKNYCMTEVVNKVFRAFLGKRSLKAIAAQNSSTRLLLGKMMHAA